MLLFAFKAPVPHLFSASLASVFFFVHFFLVCLFVFFFLTAMQLSELFETVSLRS